MTIRLTRNRDACCGCVGDAERVEIGLVSSYGACLSQLIRVVLNMHPEIVLTSDKTIKLSELSTFSSIEEARATLSDREIMA